MDIIARKLGMDPVELRLKNAIEEGYAGPGGDRYRGVGIRETLLKVAEKIDWQNRGGVHRGKGLAVGNWYSGAGASSAMMKLNEDGTVSLSIGAPDATGTDIMAAQVAAEELGVPLDQIVLTAKNTDHSPFDTMSSGSRITHCIGQAVKNAAADLKAKLAEAAAPLLDADPAHLELDGGAIRVQHAPERQVALGRIARSSHFRTHGPIIGSGTYFGPLSRFDRDALRGYFVDMGEDRTFVAQGAEVEVDPETGRVRVLKLVSVNDIGFAINPANAENQVFGGVHQGLGYALSEEIKMEDGRVTNPDFRGYGILRAPDMPEVECYFVEKGDGPGPYVAKGLGEQPNVPTAAAVANAVHDAIGVRVKSLPLTAEKVLAALREQEG
jgi:CO/xanthine dehydrogenase Mo-binding subunit